MFKEPFSFHGRIRRKEYALSFVFSFVSFVFLNIIINTQADSNVGILGLLGIIPLFWFLFARGAKRCHDLGNTGWLQLIPFYFVWLIFAEGRSGKNQYGEDPKIPAEKEEEVVYGKP